MSLETIRGVAFAALLIIIVMSIFGGFGGL